MVTVIVSAGGASEQMLRTCVRSLEKYENKTKFKVVLASPEHQSDVSRKVADEMKLQMFFSKEREDDMSGSRIHASVLDKAVRIVETPYLLTLDADCFPIGDWWLDVMMLEVEQGAAVSGIMHPYAPPPDDLPRTTLEYRIRSQLCWENTHVACQLVGMGTLKRLDVGFMDGDDTGLAIPMEARRRGLTVVGIKASACAFPEGEEVPDPELNRDYCLIFGNKIYHHGGGSRENQGHSFADNFWGETRRRVIDEGAEFLLSEKLHHYEYNDEEKVAKKMVDKMLRGMRLYLHNHDRLFKE